MNCPCCRNRMTYHRPTQRLSGHWTCVSCPNTVWPEGAEHDRLPDAFDRWYMRYHPQTAPELAGFLLAHPEAELKFRAMCRVAWDASARHLRKVRRPLL